MRFTALCPSLSSAGIAAGSPYLLPPPPETARPRWPATTWNAGKRAALAKRTFYTNMLNLTCVLAPETIRRIRCQRSHSHRRHRKPTRSCTHIGTLVSWIQLPASRFSNAMVELWGPNAVGEYGSTFLRGATETATNGIAEFPDYFPGYTTGSGEPPQHSGFTPPLRKRPEFRTSASSSSRIPGLTSSVQYTNLQQEHEHPDEECRGPVFRRRQQERFNSIVDMSQSTTNWLEGIIGYITVGCQPHEARRLNGLKSNVKFGMLKCS
ncbi:hypothetical protein B0H14DRAFT_3867058, partial [Mycena olivaceomarginata]